MALKAFFYSISILIILTPLIALVVFYSLSSAQTSSVGVSKVVSREAVNFINSIETDFERALDTSARSAVLSSISKVVSQGVPLSNSRSSLRTLIVNGTFPGDSATYPAMGMNYLANWVSSMQNLSSYYGLNSTITLTPSNISVANAGPYAVLVTANLSVFSQPLSNPGAFNFSRVYTVQTVVSIQGFEDPLFALNSQGLVPRSFLANSSTVYGVSSLDQAISQKVYLPNSDSPDFFNRLEGNLSGSTYGLEAIVNINDFVAQDIPIHNQSHVDHLYFNSTLSDQGFRVTGSSYSWLRLDCTHAAFYGVANQTPGC